MNVVPLDITEYYNEAVKAWGEGSLPLLDNIRVTLEPNMTKVFGRAFPKVFRRRNGQVVRRDYYAITISRPWLAALQQSGGKEVMLSQYRDTMLHELAHIAIYNMYEKVRVEPHGREWKNLARAVGIRAERCAWESDEDEVVKGQGTTWKQVVATKKNGG